MPPANNFEALKVIARNIRNTHPDKAKSYNYWGSANNLHSIIDAAPKTVNELAQIKLTNSWHIKVYLLEAEQIVRLFKPAEPEPKRKWFSRK